MVIARRCFGHTPSQNSIRFWIRKTGAKSTAASAGGASKGGVTADDLDELDGAFMHITLFSLHCCFVWLHTFLCSHSFSVVTTCSLYTLRRLFKRHCRSNCWQQDAHWTVACGRSQYHHVCAVQEAILHAVRWAKFFKYSWSGCDERYCLVPPTYQLFGCRYKFDCTLFCL